MGEVWAKVQELGDTYEVSSFGRVRNINTSKLLKFDRNSKGYLRFRISRPVMRRFFVHRLVAQKFINNDSNKPQVNHKDKNKENNHVSNLEWVTMQENIDHQYANP